MIETLIVDDEKLARDEVRFLLERHNDVLVVGEAASAHEALALMREHVPDLMLLDIQMPGMNGFELVELLGEEDLLPYIIFITAYDEYAIQAFEVNAVDYVLKPVDEDRLAQSLDRVRKQLSSRTLADGDLLRLVRQLREGAAPDTQRPPKLPVRKGDRYLLVDPSDVTHGYIIDGVVFLVTSAFTGITSHRTLEELERDLDGRVFWRVHRSHIVNIDHVTEVIPWQSGTYRLRLDDEKKTLVPLSRAQAKRLRKVLRW